jgi:hypothetical protein
MPILSLLKLQIDLSIGLLTSGLVNTLHHLVDKTIHLGQSAFGTNQSFAAFGTGFFIKRSNHSNRFSFFGNSEFFLSEKNTVNDFGKFRFGFCLLI